LGNDSLDTLETSFDAASSPASKAPGSSVASLWLQISQDNQPPTSIPAKHAAQSCPHCHHPLNLLLEGLERQACIKCGWPDQLRSPQVQNAGTLAELELKQLLEKAALESLSNMKSRKQQDTP